MPVIRANGVVDKITIIEKIEEDLLNVHLT
jgi:hypothetical protein